MKCVLEQNECCQYAIWHILVRVPIGQNKMAPVFQQRIKQ